MLPEICSIGPFTVYSYGLMIAIGVIAAIWLGEYEAKRSGIMQDGFLTSLAIISVIGGFIGAKILYFITILPEILEDTSKLKSLSNGFVVYGGLIGGIVTAYVYCRIKKVDFWAAFDMAAPLIALAQGFGRIGCFLAGCCYGQHTESFLGVVFANTDFAPVGEKLFPIQLVSSGLNFINFLLLFILWRVHCKEKEKNGMIGATYVITYSIGRFVLEFFRGDIERGSVGVLSTSQFISIFTVIAGGIMLIYRYTMKDKENRKA